MVYKRTNIEYKTFPDALHNINPKRNRTLSALLGNRYIVDIYCSHIQNLICACTTVSSCLLSVFPQQKILNIIAQFRVHVAQSKQKYRLWDRQLWCEPWQGHPVQPRSSGQQLFFPQWQSSSNVELKQSLLKSPSWEATRPTASIRNPPHFMECRSSLSWLQEPAPCP
jgi:hypothetical protein